MTVRVGATRTARGAAAVEFALVFAAVLAPLMVGVLYYGYFFWKLQSVPTLDPELDQSSFVGTYCTSQLPDLLARVEAATLVAVSNVDGSGALPLQLSDVTASVLTYTPDRLGVDIRIKMVSPAMSESVSLLPLPNDGNVTSDAVIRLQNVRVSSGSC